MAKSLNAEELLGELDKYFKAFPVREEGWVDYKQVAKHMNVHVSTANKRMNILVEDGIWESKKVYDPEIKTNITVYRLKQNSPPPRKEREG